MWGSLASANGRRHVQAQNAEDNFCVKVPQALSNYQRSRWVFDTFTRCRRMIAFPFTPLLAANVAATADADSACSDKSPCSRICAH